MSIGLWKIFFARPKMRRAGMRPVLRNIAIPEKLGFYDTNGVLKYREYLEYSRFMIRTWGKIS